MPPSEPPLFIVKSRSLVSSWFWAFCWFSFFVQCAHPAKCQSWCCRLLKGNGVTNKQTIWKKPLRMTRWSIRNTLLLEGLQLLDDGVLILKFMIINKTLWNMQSFIPSRNVTSSVRHEIWGGQAAGRWHPDQLEQPWYLNWDVLCWRQLV